MTNNKKLIMTLRKSYKVFIGALLYIIFQIVGENILKDIEKNSPVTELFSVKNGFISFILCCISSFLTTTKTTVWIRVIIVN